MILTALKFNLPTHTYAFALFKLPCTKILDQSYFNLVNDVAFTTIWIEAGPVARKQTIEASRLNLICTGHHHTPVKDALPTNGFSHLGL